MKEKTLRAAVIGVGKLGQAHARIYGEIPGVQLVAVADRDEKAAREIAKRSKCDWVTDPAKLPQDLDLVSVAVNTVDHCKVALPFLQRGVATLVEKPISMTVEEADRMIEAARKSGAVLAVGHIERFNPAIQAVKEFHIEPRFIESHRLAAFSGRSLDVGVVMDLMIHDLDLVLELVHSEIESIDAVGGAMVTEKEDIASVRIRFKNGAVANLTASRVSLQPMRKMRIFSSMGYVALDFGKNYALLVKKGERFEEKKKELFKPDPSFWDKVKLLMQGDDFLFKREMKIEGSAEPLRLELEAFAQAVRNKTDAPVTGEDGRRALAAAQAVLDQLSHWKW